MSQTVRIVVSWRMKGYWTRRTVDEAIGRAVAGGNFWTP
jgi:hypothetical protein